jgi:GNAT superfamily N-acetyltransferase
MKIPQWRESDRILSGVLDAAGFEVGLTQEMMVMPLDEVRAPADTALHLEPVGDSRSVSEWTRIASESFGYYIHEPVVAGLVGARGCHLFIAHADGGAVGTGLLLQSDAVAGLHMVGVPPAHRRRGYARQIMFGLIALARELGCNQATLQASAAGGPLYGQLGFVPQGIIQTWSRKNAPA